MSVKFIIVGAPRTGSTLLVRTLNTLTGVRCHGELLQRNMVRGLEDGFDPDQATADERKVRAERLYAEREKNPLGFITHALAGEGAAIGMKITYEIFFDPRWESVVSALTGDSEVRFIHLERHNGLRRYISEEVLYAGGPNHSGAGGRSKQTVKISIDIDAFMARQVELAGNTEQFLDMTRKCAVMALSYESLTTDFTSAMAQTCAFLDENIDASGIVAALSKVGAKDLRETVNNVDELLAHPTTREFVLSD